MEDERFDELAKTVASADRRSILKRLAGAVGAGLLAVTGQDALEAKRKGKGKGKRKGKGNKKVVICHNAGNGNWQTIEIAEKAWPAHAAHGDNTGPCSTTGTTAGPTSPPAYCGGECKSDEVCKQRAGGDKNCRCVKYGNKKKCQVVTTPPPTTKPPHICAGECKTHEQCKERSGGNSNCRCVKHGTKKKCQVVPPTSTTSTTTGTTGTTGTTSTTTGTTSTSTTSTTTSTTTTPPCTRSCTIGYWSQNCCSWPASIDPDDPFPCNTDISYFEALDNSRPNATRQRAAAFLNLAKFGCYGVPENQICSTSGSTLESFNEHGGSTGRTCGLPGDGSEGCCPGD